MNTKNLIVLALVGIVILTGALIVATSGMQGGKIARAPMSQDRSARPAEGTVSGAAAQTSAEVVVDNVDTSVTVQ